MTTPTEQSSTDLESAEPSAALRLPSYEFVSVAEPAEGVALVTIDRPGRANALGGEVTQQLRAALEAISESTRVRVVILTGVGKIFVAGADVNVLLNSTHVFDNRDMLEDLRRTFDMIERLKQPVIAAVNGVAIGAGAELAAACDFTIAADTATFAMPETVMGMVSSIQSALFPYYAPIGHIREWLYTGEHISAETAVGWGLVNRCVPSTELMDEVLRVAVKIAGYPAEGVQFQKELINTRWLRSDLDTAIRDGIHFSTLAHTTGESKTRVAAAIAARKAAARTTHEATPGDGNDS